MVNGFQKLFFRLPGSHTLELRARHSVMAAAAQIFHDDLNVQVAHRAGGKADVAAGIINDKRGVHLVDAEQLGAFSERQDFINDFLLI